jgi:hypothetical protein
VTDDQVMSVATVVLNYAKYTMNLTSVATHCLGKHVIINCLVALVSFVFILSTFSVQHSAVPNKIITACSLRMMRGAGHAACVSKMRIA